MYTKIMKSLFLILIFPIGNCYAGWFGPSNYEECILEKMKDAKSNYAAIAIANACGKKFPKKEPVVEQKLPQELPSKVIDQLIVKCDVPIQAEDRRSNPASYLVEERKDLTRCSLYNGNSEWSVHSLIVRFRDLDSGEYHDFDNWMGPAGVGPMRMASKAIALDLSIFPRKMDAENRSVSIVSGKGYKK
jgi:hypothetical protein